MKKRSVDIRENDGVHTWILAKLGLIVNMLVLVFLLASCSQRFVSDSRIALGTAVYIRVAGDEDVLSGAFDVIYDADRAISRFTEGSWIWEINENAGIQPVAVPDDIYTLIKRSFDMAYATDGVFNPMIGPLSSLWGMGTEDARVPDDEEIMAVLPLLDYRKAVLDDNARTVYLPEKGMSLDLGAVGKGWASDLVRDYLSSEGVENALINLGGNIVVTCILQARMASGIPGTILSHTSSVASGVTSLLENPVPPVVKSKSARSSSAILAISAPRSDRSSGRIF